MSTPPLRPAAFLDRDGVLNVDHGYVHRPEDFDWMPGVVTALRALQEAGHALVVVTNQSGIARGYYTEAQYWQLADWITTTLADQGVHLAGQYHCPHLPDAPVAAYARACDCRKPGPGMLTRACRELGLDPAASWIFGDKPGDLQAGWAAGLRRGVLLGEDAVGPDGPRLAAACTTPPGAWMARHRSLAEAVAAAAGAGLLAAEPGR